MVPQIFPFKQWLFVHMEVITMNVTKDKHDKNHNNNTLASLFQTSVQLPTKPSVPHA